MRQFIEIILKKMYGDAWLDIFENSPLLKYLDAKMGAIEGDSKTRRSLANIYAIYSITKHYEPEFYQQKEEYKVFEGYDYTKLFMFYRTLYGGEKLQNHALNSRVNGEFDNKFPEHQKPLIIVSEGKYALHIDYLYVGDIDISPVVNTIVEQYMALLIEKDAHLIAEIQKLLKLNNTEQKKNKITQLISEKAEARIFEIIAYAILKNHYKNTEVYIGYSITDLKKEPLQLYKTGRTNANDGGIDFVMKPLGRFFQVTEVNHYDKYLLDIDKVMHFPITFVIKTQKTKQRIAIEISQYIDQKSGGMEILKQRYFHAFEEIITINELVTWLKSISEEGINDILKDIETYYKLELNISES